MKSLRSIAQYFAMIALTVALLWLSLRGLKVEGADKSTLLVNAWRSADKFYLFMVAVTAMVSHVLRAERWRMLLLPTGNAVSLTSSFLSLMIGYLVNLAVPRGGEFSRCYNLYKLQQTPVEISFGTVVLERMVDVVCLVALIAISFFVEWDKLIGFIKTLPFSWDNINIAFLIVTLVGAAAAFGVAFYFLRKNDKIIKIVLGFKEGILSVFKLKNKTLFITYSVMIWGLYFLMSYFVVLAFPQTAALGFSAVLTLFAIGSIAMAAPLPGGAGSYHTLVPLGLVMLYQLPQADAIAFVFIFHGWQTLIMIVAGVVSLLISYLIMRWKPLQK